MYFAHLYSWYVFVISIALWLSINSVIDCCWGNKASSKKENNYIICCTAQDTTIYLALVVDVATISCYLVNQDARPLPT